MDRSIVNPFAPKEARLTFVANCLSDSEYIRLFQILNSRDFADHPNPFTEPAGFRGMCPAFLDGATSKILVLYYCIDFLLTIFQLWMRGFTRTYRGMSTPLPSDSSSSSTRVQLRLTALKPTTTTGTKIRYILPDKIGHLSFFSSFFQSYFASDNWWGHPLSR